jgi:LacI family transcriptional regulator, repressor for deo operon, udp, cdd, tsx, nupC, and nupG
MNSRASPLSKRIRTMEEFAVASGISRPTLSRFFNDPGSVRPSSRQRIEAAMDRLGYRPNLFAVNFNRRNTKTVGIIVPTLLDPFYAALVQRIEFEASALGYWTVIQSSQGEPDREAEAVSTLVSINSAGAVVVPLGAASRKGLYRQMEKAMPLVFLDTRADAGGAFVGTDNHVSMGLIVDYLLRSGPPPSYIGMPAVNQNAGERRKGYEAAMLERSAEPVVFDLPHLGWNFERLAFDEATRLFKTGAPLGETILCANDRVAFGVMAAACQIGRSVGRLAELRVAGHDDHPLSQYACPSLTTVAQDVVRLATLSLERLMEGIAEGTNENSNDRLDARLIMRNSA